MCPKHRRCQAHQLLIALIGASAAAAEHSLKAPKKTLSTSCRRKANKRARHASPQTHQECKVVKISAIAMALWFLMVLFATESNKATPPEAMPSRANESARRAH